MKSSFSKGILLSIGLGLSSSLFGVDAQELSSMKTKALQGNVVAQYNLGRLYMDPAADVFDRAEAYAWLKLAADTGTGSLELVKLTEEMSPAELNEGRLRLESRRRSLRVANAQPGAVTESAPVNAQAMTQLLAERDGLAASLEQAKEALAAADALSKRSLNENAQLKANLAKLVVELDKTRNQLRDSGDRLRKQTEENSRQIAELKQELLQSQSAEKTPVLLAAEPLAPVAEPAVAADPRIQALEAKLAQAEEAAQSAEALRIQNQATLEKAQAGAELAKTELALVREQLSQRDLQLAALRRQLVNAPKAEEVAALQTARDSVASEVSELRLQLATLSQERDAQARQVNELSGKLAIAEDKLAVEKVPSAAPDTGLDEVRAQLAETEQKLEMALRSYTLLQQAGDKSDELAKEKQGSLESALATSQASEARLGEELASSRSSHEATQSALNSAQAELEKARLAAQVASNEAGILRDQVRQMQAQLALAVEENQQLRTKLAVIVPPPSSGLSTPVRPGSAAAKSTFVLPEVLKPVQAAPVVEVPVAQPPVRQHIVAPGDTLTKISRKHYGTPDRWKDIFEANPNILSDPAKLPIGAALNLPE